MNVPVQIIAPILVLVTATLWTCFDFWFHPVRDPKNLPWPIRRSMYEGALVVIVWSTTCVAYWQLFRPIILWQALAVGFIWMLVTIYASTGLRQRAVDKAYRERGL